MKKTLSSIAAAAVLVASTAITPALAQSNTTTPAPATPAAPAAPADNGNMNGKMAPGSMSSASTTAPGQGYITEQSETQVSANTYIGKSIYNNENESIGSVNDLIFEQNGGIVAAVVGVGGFLGMGQKDVALPMDKLTITRDANNKGDIRLTTMETADALKNAPEYKTLADKQAETDATTTSSTATMPAANGGATNSSTAPSK